MKMNSTGDGAVQVLYNIDQLGCQFSVTYSTASRPFQVHDVVFVEDRYSF